MSIPLIIIISSLCGIAWVNAITHKDGIFEKLPAKTGWLPSLVFIPLYQCSKCNSFYWAILLTIIYEPTIDGIFIPIASVGLTTILSHVTKIN